MVLISGSAGSKIWECLTVLMWGLGGSLGSLVLIWGPDTCQRVLLGMRARIARR